jgi:hypothetical protein
MHNCFGRNDCDAGIHRLTDPTGYKEHWAEARRAHHEPREASDDAQGRRAEARRFGIIAWIQASVSMMRRYLTASNLRNLPRVRASVRSTVGGS